MPVVGPTRHPGSRSVAEAIRLRMRADLAIDAEAWRKVPALRLRMSAGMTGGAGVTGDKAQPRSRMERLHG
jgi:hypothetical protein